MNYLYLHGFASGPQSLKVTYFRDRFAAQGIDLRVPDLNQDDFFNLTLTRQIQQCEAILTEKSGPWCLIGSSFGGLTAAWLSQRNPQIERLFLLAPAFNFLVHWQACLGNVQLQQWQQSGAVEIYHYGAQRSLPLSYQFWQDASQYSETALKRPVSTLILHGIKDEVIPVESSRAFVQQRTWCRLVELDSDHALGDVLPILWQHMDGLGTAVEPRTQTS